VYDVSQCQCMKCQSGAGTCYCVFRREAPPAPAVGIINTSARCWVREHSSNAAVHAPAKRHLTGRNANRCRKYCFPSRTQKKKRLHALQAQSCAMWKPTRPGLCNAGRCSCCGIAGFAACPAPAPAPAAAPAPAGGPGRCNGCRGCAGGAPAPAGGPCAGL
jgi:hypothetical protein